MVKLKFYVFNDFQWKHHHDEEIEYVQYVKVLGKGLPSNVDEFYRIECFRGDELLQTIHTINPFMFDVCQ